ncbi:hypothetical protein [Inconstantimicrobium porci]|uniref:Uncharacterized protein n=1 Tax=Inconstantimicrobium porci TaxID=2652291 RepID=A0A7X2T387_9CLOT|nr:hypothetical protein [Inconstantimicrobium porci]MSR92748.1 hypothetical protein [Inconstantimicrobium porci]
MNDLEDECRYNLRVTGLRKNVEKFIKYFKANYVRIKNIGKTFPKFYFTHNTVYSIKRQNGNGKQLFAEIRGTCSSDIDESLLNSYEVVGKELNNKDRRLSSRGTDLIEVSRYLNLNIKIASIDTDECYLINKGRLNILSLEDEKLTEKDFLLDSYIDDIVYGTYMDYDDSFMY